MTDPRFCGACEGITQLTPIKIANRPGLDVLSYRIGTHGSFFQSLLARLSTLGIEGQSPIRRPMHKHLTRDLRHALEGIPSGALLRDLLTTRQPTDPSIALLDAWATLADVLTFYQERLANEGFLRTARERRSIEELARLIGYRLRPGVSSTVYLAFEVEDTATQPSLGTTTATSAVSTEVRIPTGTAAKSTPTPGSDEEPQTFETSKELLARKEWNELVPRQTKPPRLAFEDLLNLDHLYFEGLGLRIQPNDWLVIDSDPEHRPEIRQVLSVDPDNDRQCTRVAFRRDALSARQLVENVEERVNAFLTAFAESRAEVKPDFAVEIRQKLRVQIDEAYTAVELRRMEGTDANFHDFVCKQLLASSPLTPPAVTDPIRGGTTAVVSWAAKAVDLLAASKTDVLGTRGIVATLYKPLHDELKLRQSTRVDVATTLSVDLGNLGPGPNPDKVAAATELVKRALWNTAFGTNIGTNIRPACVICPQARYGVASADHLVCKDVIAFDFGSLPTDLTISAKLFAKRGIDADPTDVIISDGIPNLQTAIRSLTATLAANDGSRWVQISVKDLSSQVIALAMQEVGVQGQAFSTDFPLLQNEKTVIYRRGGNAGQRIDPGFTLVPTAGPLAKWTVELQLESTSAGTFGGLVGDPDFEFDPSIANKVRTVGSNPRTDKQLQEAISKITFTPSIPAAFDHAWVTLIIRKEPTGSPVEEVAAALREVIVQEATVLPLVPDPVHLVAVRERFGKLHGELQSSRPDPATAVTDFGNAVTALQAGQARLSHNINATDDLSVAMENSQSRRNAWKALTPTDPSGEALRDESLGALDNADRPAKDEAELLVDQASTNINREINTLSAQADVFSGLPGGLNAAITAELAELQSVPNWNTWTPLEAAKKVDEARARLETLTKQHSTAAVALDALADRLANGIIEELTRGRTEFRSRLEAIRRTHDILFRPPVANPQDLVRLRLDQVRDTLASYETTPSKCDPERRLHYLLNVVRSEMGEQIPGHTPITGDSLATLATRLTGDAETAIKEKIFGRWKSLLGQLSERTGQPSTQPNPPPMNSVEEVINALKNLPFGSPNAAISLQQILEKLGKGSDLISQLAGKLDARRREALFEVFRTVRVTKKDRPKVFAMRSTARLFGWNAPDKEFDTLTAATVLDQLASGISCLVAPPSPAINPERVLLGSNIHGLMGERLINRIESPRFDRITNEPDKEDSHRLFLDGAFDRTGVGGVVAIRKAASVDATPTVFRIQEATSRPRSAYTLHGETTRIILDGEWWSPSDDPAKPEVDHFSVVQTTRVLCDAEELKIAEEPVAEFLPAPTELLEQPNEIVLDQPAFGLSVGKFLVVQGPQSVRTGDAEVISSELVEIAGIHHEIDPDVFNDRYVSRIVLRNGLQFSYRREKTRIRANVVEATHGETQREVLGSGDGTREFQKFLLKRPEVTQLVAPNERGIKSTLVVKVNDVDWQEQESLREAKRDDEQFVTRTDDAQQMTVVFGDGEKGARLPTGVENVRAEYRTGLGRKGNVAGGQINQLLGAPLGVKKVNNPLAAKGGADPESRDLAREHAPLAVTAMDRLVSVQDYEDFARTYAGIGKASASLLQGAVHVTIAGLDPEPLEQDNPLFGNLMQALEIFGDPSQKFELHNREASLLILIGKVKIDPRREWEKVQPKIRDALLWKFSYERSELGQDILLSDAIATIQAVEGVVYVDVDTFDVVRQEDVPDLASQLREVKLQPRIHVKLARLKLQPPPPNILAAELCYLTPDIPDTLILEQIR